MPRLSKIGAAALAAFGWTSGSAVSASYLVVAGGGSGGGGYFAGGGGAGGLLTGAASLNPTLTYTITIGAGAATVSGNSTNGLQGSNTTFSAIATTAVGGGYGAGYGASGVVGGVGGSGGGTAANALATVAAGTSGQGNAGGQSSNNGGGGGGGAGSVGGNAGASFGTGGTGSASSISGSSVTYAAGAAGGITGVGNGASGTANTGNGGAASSASGGTSGAGGSGIVIISYVGAQQFSGGVVTSSGGNTIHTFTTSGTLGPVTPLSANYLVVAGGGGGGGSFNSNVGSGGGGAGGLLSGSSLTIDPYSTYVVTVGGGGTGAVGGVGNTAGTNGANSAFSMVSTTAVGGGYGAWNVAAGSGGSGGGATDLTYAPSAAAGSGTSGQGYAGANATIGLGTGSYGGGGGGAGAVGGGGSGVLAGTGGVGVASSISGASTYYAGGGGGGSGNGSSTVGGPGGNGGGGTGGYNAVGSAGTANTGGGGGGAGTTSGGNKAGGNGGSGVVIISYAGSTQLMAGGVVTIAGGNVIHTFNSSGYLTPLTLLTRSLRFRQSATAYLSRTYATPTSTTIATISFWYKRGLVGNSDLVTAFGTVSTTTGNGPYLQFTTNGALRFVDQSSDVITSAFFRDPAAWYHFVLAIDTTQATAANRLKFYVNGVQITSFSSATYGAQNYASNILAAGTQYIGYSQPSNARGSDGYMAEVNFIDGQALAPTAFGTFNSYGVWQPITYGGSYGTNGFRLPFTNNASTTTLGYDFSPQGNNWTTNNISVTAGSTYDSMTDVPTLTSATAANTATFNPLAYAGTVATNGNLTATATGTAGGCYMIGTMGAYAIKTYFEVTVVSDNQTATEIGVTSATNGTASNIRNNSISYGITGSKNVLGTGSAYGASYTNGDVIGVAVDGVNGTITFYKNNTSQGVITNSFISANTTLPAYVFFSSGGSGSVNLNCGQRPFTYTPPTGYLALNTFNL